MVVQHNLSAMNANRMYGITYGQKAKTTEKLSSGYKINRAADDAAGLSISEKMRRQVRGLNQGTKNIQDGISTAQIMDGAMSEVQDILHRMTELSVKAANGTLTPEDRNAIENEMKQLRAELNRTTDTANFNEKPLLKAGDITLGSSTSGSGKTDVVFLIDNTGSMGTYINNVVSNLSTFAGGLSGCNVQYGVVKYGEESEGAATAYPMTDSAATLRNTISGIGASGGGDENESALEAIMKATEYPFRSDATKEFILVTDAPFHDKNVDARSTWSNADIQTKLATDNIRLSVVTSPRYMDYYENNLANGKVLNMEYDFADGLENLAKNISETAGGVFHKNPEDIRIQMSGDVDDFFMLHTYDISVERLGLTNATCLTQEDAEKTIDLVKHALSYVSAVRSSIGAEQNALEHAYRVRDNVAENTTDAESRIRDTDMSKSMVELSLQNILQQAGQTMMTQANQSNQGVLSLLQ